MATQNSIQSYVELIETDELGEKQREVYEFIALHPDVSYNDICRATKMHHNTVTARIKELRDGGYIYTSGDKIDAITGKRNAKYRIRRVGDPLDKPPVKHNHLTIPKQIADELMMVLG